MIDFDGLTLASAMAIFGELVTYHPGAGPSRQLIGVFDEKYAETQFGSDGIPVVTYRPMLNTRRAYFPPGQPYLSEAFAIRGRLWRVSQPPETDSIGGVKIALQLATDAEATAPAQPAKMP